MKVKIGADSSLFLTLLLVLFIGLKLTGYITWSWWWVLAPFWAPLGVALVALLVLLLAAAKQ